MTRMSWFHRPLHASNDREQVQRQFEAADEAVIERSERVLEERIRALRRWRDVGDKFEYLGFTMVVSEIAQPTFVGFGVACGPVVEARYINAYGAIASFTLKEEEVLGLARIEQKRINESRDIDIVINTDVANVNVVDTDRAPDNHTYGPWSAGSKGSRSVVSINHDAVAMENAEHLRYYGGKLVAEGISRNNIPLIAAAPELLHALRNLLEAVDAKFPTSATMFDAIASAEAAVSKATARPEEP